jgi:hypothetical protein
MRSAPNTVNDGWQCGVSKSYSVRSNARIYGLNGKKLRPALSNGMQPNECGRQLRRELQTLAATAARPARRALNSRKVVPGAHSISDETIDGAETRAGEQ